MGDFMSLILNGTTGVSKVQDGSIVQADLASGVAGTGPAFSAYRSGANQSITSSVITKIQFNTEEFDTNNCYDTSNYRFTPNVAGYYLITLSTFWDTISSATYYSSLIYKNGNSSKVSQFLSGSITSQNQCLVTAIIYLNGSSDYIEGYAYHNGTGTIASSQSFSFFQASLVRSA